MGTMQSGFEGHLIAVDRATWKGFIEYWKERQWHFKDLYHRKFTHKTAREVYRDEVLDGAAVLAVEKLMEEDR